MSDPKIKKGKRKAKLTEDKALEVEESSPKSRKKAVQGPSNASSPSSVKAASPKIPTVVASAPLASKRAIEKVVQFEYGYPIEEHPYRPSDEFSEDDDEFSISRKKQEMAIISELNESYKAQLSGSKLQDEGEEDCPFWSHTNLANHSRLFFGSSQEMSKDVWDETARRILIMREFILSHHNGSINQQFLDDNDDRSVEIPR